MSALHRILAFRHKSGPRCPFPDQHIVLECSCGWVWSVEVADDIAGVIRHRHPGAIWAKHEMETA